MILTKQYIRVASIIVLLFFSLSAKAQETETYKITKVVIDAGHGGKDPGAIGHKKHEKDIALAIALKAGHYIDSLIAGVEVLYTRTTDKFVPLKERAEFANSNNADVFISIHVNAVGNKEVRGTSTYVMGIGKTNDNTQLARLENSVITYEENYKENYAGYDPDAPESHIVFSLVQNAFQEQSLLLAKLIQDQFRTRVSRKDLGVKQAELVVLWYTTMPSVLVETGFITNDEDVRFLSDEKGQSYMASAIYRAFKEYKTLIESRSNYTNHIIHIKNPNPHEFVPEPMVRYRVQIRSSVKPIKPNSSEFKKIKNVEELEYGGRYNYVVGKKKTMKEAIALQSQIRKKIPDAYIIATKGDKVITIAEAKKELQEK